METGIKKYKIPAYGVIYLLSIVFLLNVVQCKCSNQGVDPDLSLKVEKDNLIGPQEADRTTKVTITNSGEAAADLSQDGLLAGSK